ncbi:MAG: undecaprenyldiphospho-muramoylpentapeptide beta-N-acetylglucosaminyltransferase [Oscillospiraceae bacterium]|jgi:UDP-N-acetylglucosamine--N-acetylmuramyl-(pentapeptide) pyrophosphoryl-undecaprenol N-acetylglucosamine transferase|nr:undecaprenyldiphospho-muramoylpentapeptide beta-N-acetylglucosaminyltransferase [Oscillospiraceae bacterium]
MKFKIVVTGGGTVGHISPLLAVLQVLKEQHDLEALYVGCASSLEEELAKSKGITFKALNVSGFSRRLGFQDARRNLLAIFRLVGATWQSWRFLRDFEPDVVFATGGYVCTPILLATRLLKIKRVIHEQNAIPGLTTKIFEGTADVVLLASASARRYIKNKNAMIVGNPVSSSFLHQSENPSNNAKSSQNVFLIVSFGGSLGAMRLNETIADVLVSLAGNTEIRWIHATGRANYHEFITFLQRKGLDLSKHPGIEVCEYIGNMPDLLHTADLVIARAGAMTIAELQATGKACILIPSPNVTNNHQLHNANTLAEKGAAIVLEEKDLTAQVLLAQIKILMKDHELLRSLGQKMRGLAVLDSAQRICQIITDVVVKSRKGSRA